MIITNIKIKNGKLVTIELAEQSSHIFRPVCLVGDGADKLIQDIQDLDELEMPNGQKVVTYYTLQYPDSVDIPITLNQGYRKGDPYRIYICKNLDTYPIKEQVALFSKIQASEHMGLIFTTKLPYLVSDCQPKDVYMVDEKGKITKPDFQTFGASFNLIMMKVLKIQETIPVRAMNYLDEVGQKQDYSLLESNYIGDSIEKTLLYLSISNAKKKEAENG